MWTCLKTCQVLPKKGFILESAFLLFNFIHKYKNKPRQSLYRITGYVYAALRRVYWEWVGTPCAPWFIRGSASLDPCKQMAEVCWHLSVAVLSLHSVWDGRAPGQPQPQPRLRHIASSLHLPKPLLVQPPTPHSPGCTWGIWGALSWGCLQPTCHMHRGLCTKCTVKLI